MVVEGDVNQSVQPGIVKRTEFEIAPAASVNAAGFPASERGYERMMANCVAGYLSA